YRRSPYRRLHPCPHGTATCHASAAGADLVGAGHSCRPCRISRFVVRDTTGCRSARHDSNDLCRGHPRRSSDRQARPGISVMSRSAPSRRLVIGDPCHRSYVGDTSPRNWGTLAENGGSLCFPLCADSSTSKQSPIDIQTDAIIADPTLPTLG